jgi:uncharacterized membrane protein
VHWSVFHKGIFIAILAHALIGISLLSDKVLLRQQQIKNLASYVFWLGIISIFGLALIPFGFTFPGWSVAGLAFGAGMCNLIANFLYYGALKKGEASETLAMMGGFSPVCTALIAIPLLAQPLCRDCLLSFVLMVAGGFLMFFSEKVPPRKIMRWVISASAVFGLVNVLEKVVFNNTNFVSGYVFFTIGTFVASLLMLLRPRWRASILADSEEAPPRSRTWYLANRFAAGVGSFLIFYAVSLDSPAIVDAITGIRYVIIFLGAYSISLWRPAWLRENFTGWALVGKSAATALVVAGLVLLGVKGSGSGQSARSTTPHATTDAPSHRCHVTCSPSTYLARTVSRM